MSAPYVDRDELLDHIADMFDAFMPCCMSTADLARLADALETVEARREGRGDHLHLVR